MFEITSIESSCRLGNERWLDALAWSNASDFQAAHPKIWTVNSTHAGSVRAAGGLQFVKVLGAGHMVRYLEAQNISASCCADGCLLLTACIAGLEKIEEAIQSFLGRPLAFLQGSIGLGHEALITFVSKEWMEACNSKESCSTLTAACRCQWIREQVRST